MKFIVGILMIIFTASAFADSTQRLTVTGSSTIAPLVLEMAKRYESSHEGIRIDVQTGGSSRGVSDARSGLADIGMVSRALKTSEQDLIPHLIARDGIGLIVHRDNPVGELSREQVIDIFTGKITNWQQVGGEDRRIVVVNKAEGRSTLELFLQFFSLKNSQIRPQIIIGDNQQGIKTVSGNPAAIGYVSIGSAEHEESLGASIKRLPMDGLSPTVAHVANGSFPLSRPLNLVVGDEVSPLAIAFLEFAQSSEVSGLIEDNFFVVP